MKFTIALCQMAGSEDKSTSMKTAEEFAVRAADQGADVVVLPEMWNCPYANEYFRPYAEPADGESVHFMNGLARRLGVYLIGGSIPELDDGRVYNSCFSFDRHGDFLGKHRKAHLFDIDVEGGMRFKESDTLTAGDTATVIETEFGKIGVAICYDVRFPELSRKMALEGARMIILPAAFNMTTGPAHWALTLRARALDNQVYFAACSPARVPGSVYEAYGHSLVADPWGKIIAEADAQEQLLMAEIDTDYVESIRRQLPLLAHRREELY
ncbi:MAG: carbon-nitrogen hydrolase family protein [Eubacteriales bacterium]|nr:carbon-nitrogen hydrolase family protein [Eubacteriales bacterium]